MSGNTNPNYAGGIDNLVGDFSSLTARALSYIKTNAIPFFDISESRFGARVDGSTNDSVAVNLAVAAAVAAGGGVIWFPSGTTKITNQITCQLAGVDCDIVFAGNGGASRIAPVMSGIEHLFRFGNINRVSFQDLCFIGQSSGGSSTNAREAYSHLFNIDAVYGTTFERCSFFGLYVEAEALINVNNTSAYLKDCNFWSCITLAMGVIRGTGDLRGLEMDNCFFNDYGTYNGIYYDKVSKVGNVHSWVQTTALNAQATAVGKPCVVIKNSRFDENTSTGLLNLVGEATRSLVLENNSFNPGYGAIRTLDIGTWKRVDMIKNTLSYPTNVVETEGARFRTIDDLYIDGQRHGIPAKYITLGAGMKRAIIRNSDFNSAGGTYASTSGINNTGTCVVDCDNYTPITASAAALRPLAPKTIVSGTTNITSITTTDLKPNTEIVLIFQGILTVTDGSNLKLNGNFVTSADDVLKLFFDGTNFYEISRSAN